MQISIIILIYKVEKYIERCINSVITQTFTDYEVILVDDKSPDNALQIAEKLLQENNIAFQSVKHKKNKGLSEARNSGIKVAKGKYIMFMDSDDELSQHNVLTQFHEAIEREQADFVTANTHIIYSDTDIRKENKLTKATTFQNETILEAFLHSKISMSAWNKLVNKDFLLRNNLFFPTGKTYEDEFWFFQCCVVAHKCYCLPNYTYNYYKNILNAMANSRGESDWNDMLWLIQEQLNLTKEKQLLNNQNSDAFIHHFKRLAQQCLRPRVLKNKKQWLGYYKQIQNIYRQSELWQYKKLFRFPAQIAYFVRKEKRSNKQNNGNRFYGKLLRFLHNYNG